MPRIRLDRAFLESKRPALVLVGLALALVVATATVYAPGGDTRESANCGRTSVGLTPLVDLAARRYKGHAGGLYPGGRNRPSTPYLRTGLAQMRRVRPIDGKIVLLSVGMSNTAAAFEAFEQLAERSPLENPRLVIVNGARGGWDATRMNDPNAEYWAEVDRLLAAEGVAPSQVQAAWVKQAIARESRPFPKDARVLQAHLSGIVRIMRDRYPNLRLVYLSSRTYAGYATSSLNPEPYAYESGFAVKWTIQDRIEGKLTGPWLGWGPYLWTDGTKGRSDGFTWTCADVSDDGTHPSQRGREKAGALLNSFFTRDPTAKSWFLAP